MAKIRTFIGIPVSDQTRAAAAAIRQTLFRSGANVKWVSSETMHITLLFLGDIDELETVPVCRTVIDIAKALPAFSVRVDGLGAFPNLRRPKVIWGGITEGSEEMIQLQKTLSDRLSDQGLYVPEERGYQPHLTLGRSRSEADGQLLAAELAKYTIWNGGSTHVEEILIFRSELRKAGPEYTVLGRAPLAG